VQGPTERYAGQGPGATSDHRLSGRAQLAQMILPNRLKKHKKKILTIVSKTRLSKWWQEDIAKNPVPLTM